MLLHWHHRVRSGFSFSAGCSASHFSPSSLCLSTSRTLLWTERRSDWRKKHTHSTKVCDLSRASIQNMVRGEHVSTPHSWPGCMDNKVWTTTYWHNSWKAETIEVKLQSRLWYQGRSQFQAPSTISIKQTPLTTAQQIGSGELKCESASQCGKQSVYWPAHVWKQMKFKRKICPQKQTGVYRACIYLCSVRLLKCWDSRCLMNPQHSYIL
jgi:hypothetical protein